MAKNRLDYQAQLSRHTHDVSAGYSASIAPAMIVPQYHDMMSPGDTMYFNTSMFARLQDVVTAFRGEIDLHVDYFFVPLQMLYTPFGQIFAQTDDYLTSLYDFQSGRDYFPLCSVVDSIRSIDQEGTTFNHYFTGSSECIGKEYARLLDSLGCNPLVTLNDTDMLEIVEWDESVHAEIPDYFKDNFAIHPNIAPWFFAAYQAIYQKYFRNDEFEKFDVSAFNFDKFYDDNFGFAHQTLFRLRYAQRPSDYFTSLRVSPIASAVNKMGASYTDDTAPFPSEGGLLSNLLTKVNDYLGSGSNNYGYREVTANNNYIYPNSSVPNSGTNYISNPSSFNGSTVGQQNQWFPSAANIRALFAVDKFARIYGRADKTYDDQILAHFGIKIPHDVKHDLTHLKHYRVVIQSDPIYGTANIQNSDGDFTTALGQVGGQGMAQLSTLDSDPEKFTAPVHGVFMAVAYVLTKPAYSLTFDKLHLLSNRLSFPIPEFDKLGAQPLYNFEINPLFMNDANSMACRCGWQNRYQEFKRKFNRVSLNYLDYSRLPKSIYSEQLVIPTENNIYAPWQVSRPAFDLARSQSSFDNPESHLISGVELFERADALNSIMVQQFDSDWHPEFYSNPAGMFQTDPILTDFFCRAKKVSWMSETGEPDL